MTRSDTAKDRSGPLQADSWLAAILDSTSEAILGTTLEGIVSVVNPAACRLFGYSPAEFLRVSVPELTVPERAGVVSEILERIRRGERIEPYRASLVRKNGDVFPAALFVSGIIDARGDVVGCSAIIRDVSADKEADENRRVLEALVSCSPDAIYSRSLKGVITSWNSSAERLFGYTPEEIVGRSLRLLVPPEGESEIGEFTKAIAKGELVQDYQTIRLTKDGRRIPLALSLFPIRDESGTVAGIGCIARDLQRTAELQSAFRKLQRLSPRESEVLGHLADGMNNKDIAALLGLSDQTIKNYVSHILLKLNTATRTQAAAEFLAFRAFMDPGDEDLTATAKT